MTGNSPRDQSTLSEYDLIGLWTKARWHIIVSQFGPTFLLTLSVFFIDGGGGHTAAVKIAAAGILLASGILGAAAQISSANEALGIIRDLQSRASGSAVSARIIATAPWVNVVRYLTPAIFVVIYLALMVGLFFPA